MGPAAEFIAGNADLLEEILLRLPPASLIKFKCVSKIWLSTISSPRFCHRHARLHSSGRRSSGIILRTNPISQYQFLPLNPKFPSGSPSGCLNFVPHPAGTKIVQSCNGLLLCCSAKEIGHPRNFYVFNPTTNDHTLVPGLGDTSPTSAVLGVTLAFDPSRSPHYQVVCVRSVESPAYLNQIEIYSSEDRAWRLSGAPFAAAFDIVFHNGVFWNGAVHWISPSRSSLYFNIDNEQLKEMPRMPVSRNCGSPRFRYFGESCGHLHFFEIDGSRTTLFKVFEMETDYSQWFLKYEVELHSIVKGFPEIVRHYLDPGEMKYYFAFVILLLVRKGDNDSSMLIHVPGKILSHNVSDNSFKKLYEIPPSPREGSGSSQCVWLDAYEFTESLAPVWQIQENIFLS